MSTTIKQLAEELHVSEQALRQWCKKNNVRKERTKGTKATYVLDCDTVEQAKAYYLSESNERKETNQEKESNESKESRNDFETKYIQQLEQQISDLRADKQYLQERLTAAEQEKENLTKERQTILAELLTLRKQPKVIDVQAPAAEQAKAPEPHKQPAPRPRPRSEQKKQPRPQTVLATILQALRRK